MYAAPPADRNVVEQDTFYELQPGAGSERYSVTNATSDACLTRCAPAAAGWLLKLRVGVLWSPAGLNTAAAGGAEPPGIVAVLRLARHRRCCLRAASHAHTNVSSTSAPSAPCAAAGGPAGATSFCLLRSWACSECWADLTCPVLCITVDPVGCLPVKRRARLAVHSWHALLAG